MGTSLSFFGLFTPSSRKSRSSRRLPRRKLELTPQCEQLEIKIAPATFTWTGASSPQWSNAGNWLENGASTTNVPGSSDAVVFGAEASNLTNVNDISGEQVQSINIQATGYDIFGNGVTLTNGLTDSSSAGDSSLNIDITMNPGSASFPIQLTGAGTLNLAGGLSGNLSGGGLAISGPGVLALEGSRADTYSGPTTLSSSVTVELNKLGANAAIPGDLVINSGANLTFLSDNQIADASTVTLNDSTLNLSNYSDTISSLVLDGTGAASVTTGSKTLSLLGDVTASADATISGSLSLAVGTHTFDVDSGQNLTVSATVGGSGGLNETGAGTLTLNATNSYAGTTEVTGGTLLMGAANVLPATTALTVDPGSTLELAGFDQTVSSLSGSGDGQINLGSSAPTTLTVGDATDTTFAGVIEGAGGLTKQGAGTLTLTGANTFTGATDITAGTLMVNGSLDSLSAVTVQAGATLSGSGTLGNVDDWGTIAPGDASNTGVLTVNDVVFETGSTYQVALATPSNGVLNVSGTADFSGATLSASMTLPAFSPLTLVQNSSGRSFGSSGFVNLPDGSYLSIGGNSYLSNYDYNVSPHSDDVVLINVQNTTTIVQSSNLSTTYGDPVTFTAIVSGGASTPTGGVVFEADGSFLGDGTNQGSGTWTYTTSTLSAIGHQIQAVYQGDSLHGPSTSAPITQSVAKATAIITSDPTAGSITYGQTLADSKLSGGTASVAGSFAWTTPATAPGLGSTSESVTFTPTDTADYNDATASVLINVQKATPVITWNDPADITYGTALSGTQLNATTPVAGSFVYSPVAGTVLSAGPAQTLSTTFTPTDTADYNDATASVLINVQKATPVITWSDPADITYGTALSGTQLNATTPVAGSFVYSPVAGTVLGAGLQQALNTTFTPTDTADYNDATASVLINVQKATPVITWSDPADITYGTALSGTQLNATTPVAGSFVYSPVAGTVLGAGLQQALNTTFTPTDTADYNDATASVLINVQKATPVITWSDPADITYGTALSGTQLNATTPVAGSFVYSPVAGTVLGAGLQQALNTTFTPTDTADYNDATASVLINVQKATPVITWSDPADITYGTALSGTQLNATTPVAGSFVYSPVAGTVLGAGLQQALNTTFTPTDTADYNDATASVLINVQKATPVITWSDPADITYGTALSGTQLNATTPVAGSFVYSPVAGTVLGAGLQQALNTTFTPTDTADYNDATASVLINVQKATPVITWSDPADITYGTALSGTQLNATTPVAGSFVYSPVAGTVLGAGLQQALNTTFTPTDTADYNDATASVLINVQKATPVITWSDPADITYGTALSGTQLNATTPVAGSFVYSPVAGTVLGAGLQQALNTTFTPTDTADYNDATASVLINVQKATPVITWSDPADITYGTALSGTQLNATTPVAGSFVYSPVAGTVLGAGLQQALNTTFTPTDTADYSDATASVLINVQQATPTFSGLTASQTITYGTTTIDVAGTLSSPTASPVGQDVTITIDSVATTAIVGAGGSFTATIDTATVPASATPYVIAYDYAGDANFQSASDSTTTLTVNQATATFSGLTGSQTITYGTATIDVAGTLSSPTPIPAGEDVTVTIDVAATTAVVGDGGSFTATIDTATLAASATPYTIAYGYAGDANFQAASDSTTTLTVNKAQATILVTPYTVTYDGNAHTATGTATGVNGGSLSGLDLSGTTHTNAGTYSDTWTFSDPNYVSQTGTVTDTIVQANAPATLNQVLVDEDYRVFLNRAAEPAGLTNWSTQLNNGATPNSIGMAIANSTESQTDIVTNDYQNFLNRAPDSGGLASWLGQLQSGRTPDQVAAGILGSAEYFKDNGSTNQGFVSALYQSVLGRTPDSGGNAAWLNALASGVSRTQVAFDFLTSPEAAAMQVTSADYSGILNRSPDTGGLNSWVTTLTGRSPSLTNQQVTVNFIDSTENINRIDAAIAQMPDATVDQVAMSLLGPPDRDSQGG